METTHSLPTHDRAAPPAFTYGLACSAPSEADRRKRLDLLAIADQAEAMGDHATAKGVRYKADLLLKPSWIEDVRNLVTTAGKNDLGTKYFAGSAYTAAWYLLLLNASGSIAATDTLATHAGWTESTPYSGNRPQITFGTFASGSSTASPVTISITGAATITGAGICSAASGTSGILYSASNFAGPRTMQAGDSLTVIPTVSFS